MSVTIWSGLVQGAIYSLVASGYVLSLLPSGVLNFAHGAIVVGGSFFTYLWLTTLGLPVILAIALNVLVGVALGVLCELIAVRPLRWGSGLEGAPAELVTTVGLTTALAGLYGLIWGYEPLRVPFDGPSGAIEVAGVRLTAVGISIVVAAALVAVLLHLWFKRTRYGQACLAVAEDRDAATLRGVNVNVLSLGAFAAAGVLGALTGMVVGPETFAVPSLAHYFALGGFVAIAIGGVGSFLGAFLGGLLIGVVSAIAARYLGASYANIAILALLLATLVAKPHGLGGVGSGVRHV